jgi:hypothetical protein
MSLERSEADLLAEALALPADTCADIAAQLVDSLDDAVDDDAEAAWSAAIARRIRDIGEGTTELVPWTEARRRLAEQ